MSTIYAETIATNRYAPSGTEAISLYGYNGLEQLTVAQLVNAVVIRRAAVIERESVVQMNIVATDSEEITALSDGASWVLDNPRGDWTTDPVGSTYYKRLRARYDVDETKKSTEIPKDTTSYASRMQVFELFKAEIDACNSALDRIAIDLQTSVSRRDALYNVSTTVCSRAFGAMSDMAGKMI